MVGPISYTKVTMVPMYIASLEFFENIAKVLKYIWEQLVKDYEAKTNNHTTYKLFLERSRLRSSRK